MPRPLNPIVMRSLRKLGADLRDARKRRGETMELMAQRVGVTRATLARMESGDPAVCIQVYAQALNVFGKLTDLRDIMDWSRDPLGMQIFESERLPKRIRHKKA